MRAQRLGFLALLLVPAFAFAADAGPTVLDFKTGVPAAMLGKTMGMARAFFAFSVIVALLVEAFGSSPTKPKDYGGVVTRAVLVLVLLSIYGKLVGTVIGTATGVADRIAPQSIYQAFGEHNLKAIEDLRKASAAEKGEGTGILGLPSSAAVVKGYVGGALFDGLVLVCVALGQALHWAFINLSRILLSVLYVLGPLAIVFHIPAPSDVARRWFRALVTIAMWPVLSALLLAFAAQLLLRTDTAAVNGDYSTAFGALSTTLLMVAMCLAVPLMASALVGGSLKNVPMASLAAAGLGASALARGLSTGAKPPVQAPSPNAERGAGAGASSASSSHGDSATAVPPQAAPTARASGGAAQSGGGAAGDAAAADFGSAPTVASSGRGDGPALASGMPANLRVPLAAPQPPPPPADAMDKTVAGGKGHQKGRGSFAGAWKLPPVGQAVVVPDGGGGAGFKDPLMDMPRGFNAANWSDVGASAASNQEKTKS